MSAAPVSEENGHERASVDFKLLRREVSLVDLIRRDTPLSMTGRGEEYRGPCPIHGGRGKNFRVWQDRSSGEWRYCCYSKCGNEGGDAVNYLVVKDGLSRREAIARLYRMVQSGARTPYTAPKHQPAPLPPPLKQDDVQCYINCLDLPLDPAGRDKRTGLDWWHSQGLTDDAIRHFRLGICHRFPWMLDPSRPDFSTPSATIPIHETDGTLSNIRHRLLKPPSKRGDKYRPHSPGRGAHLFNAGSLSQYPDGTARRAGDVALLWEGEKKVMVGSSLDDFLLGNLYPILTPDSGPAAWLGGWGDAWERLLWEYERVVVLLDPGPIELAEKIALRFGRAGCVLQLPQKVDDWLLGEKGRLHELIGMIVDARPLLSGSVFSGWSAPC